MMIQPPGNRQRLLNSKKSNAKALQLSLCYTCHTPKRQTQIPSAQINPLLKSNPHRGGHRAGLVQAAQPG